MSEIADTARVQLFLCDYAAVDASGKLNVIGGAVTVVGPAVGTGLTTPFTLVVMIDFESKHAGELPALEIRLEHLSGEVVTLPVAPGMPGEPQTLVIAQTPEIELPAFPGLNVPRRAVRPSTKSVITFPTGLPLRLGQGYRWRVKIDGETNDAWTAPFYVPGPPAAPVFGGAAGPLGIPSVLPPDH